MSCVLIRRRRRRTSSRSGRCTHSAPFVCALLSFFFDFSTSLEINHKHMEVIKKNQAGGGVAVKIEHAVSLPFLHLWRLLIFYGFAELRKCEAVRSTLSVLSSLHGDSVLTLANSRRQGRDHRDGFSSFDRYSENAFPRRCVSIVSHSPSFDANDRHPSGRRRTGS